MYFFFFQAEDGIRDLVRSRGLGDVYKRQMIPDLNPNGLIGGTFSPEDGSISPLLAVHSFYTNAHQAGVKFQFHEPVKSLIIENGKVIGVTTPQGTYYADIIINAGGPWSREVGAMGGVNIEVHPDSHEAAITEGVAHFLDPMIVDIRPAEGSSNFYFYQHLTGQIIFCITPNPPAWGMDQRETSNFLPMVTRRMLEVMPKLKNIRVRRTWRGLYPMTPDGFPIIGWAREVDNFLQVTGMCGQGLICLLYTSDAADDLLCVDIGGRRIFKKKKNMSILDLPHIQQIQLINPTTEKEFFSSHTLF